MKELKPIPDFKNEDEEFEFWSTTDSTEYLDPAGWRRVQPPLEVPDPSVMEANYQEAQRRADAYDRGEMEAADLWEALERVNNLLPR